ncbi:hypothetical protein IAU60_004667 [Kwoniella sp. DSM 27419]
MIFPPSTSFTPLSTIALPSRHFLHPQSCNPCMDLIALLSPPFTPVAQPINRFALHKGKGKDTAGEQRTKVSLWRTGGSRVWEVEVIGRIRGMAWSEDGLFLSVLSAKPSGQSLEHLSVHTGELIKSVPISLAIDLLAQGQWVPMQWQTTAQSWEAPRNGSSLTIIDSLPQVTPVDPPKPANALPFMRPTNVVPPKATLHELLYLFPALLPSATPVPPHTLQIAGRPYLTGTFPLPTRASTSRSNTAEVDRSILALAQISNRMVGLLNTVLRGLENAEQAFRDADKQTMICREDLETCAGQQGTSIPDVHADLFHFLMTGRSGIAVNEWLGNKLTGRTIAKWDQTLDTSLRTIQSLLLESISPALERLVLLLEELKGWSRSHSPRYQAALSMDQPSIDRAIDLVLGFGQLAERMRRDAEHEMAAAGEFMKWLRYDASDELPVVTHDVKLVWSFMKNGFVHSSFHWHFPHLLEQPTRDSLPADFERYPRRPTRKLGDVLQETMTQLGMGMKQEIGTPSAQLNMSVESDASVSMSISGEMSISVLDPDASAVGDITPMHFGAGSDDDEMSRASSPDTVAGEEGVRDNEGEAPRSLVDEPWVWANTLVRDLQALVQAAVGSETSVVDRAPGDNPALYDERLVGDGHWEALVPLGEGEQQLWLSYSGGGQAAVATFQLYDADQSATLLALQFFDDEELVILLEAEDMSRYLASVRYAELLDAGLMSDRGEEGCTLRAMWRDGLLGAPEAAQVLPLARCRHIGSRPMSDEPDALDGSEPGPGIRTIEIALNGRQGRRLGCVMQEEGKALEVWDMDVDEDEEDEGAEGEDQEGEMDRE